MNKYVLARSILCLGLTVLLLLSQPLLAQTSLPACTAEIADLDRDGTNDNDGADGIIDIDKDGDGLIEICDLEGLSEIRYQLDGSSYTTSADATTITQGCPAAGCRGYELVKDLDFNAADSYRDNIVDTTWTTSSGWIPIGSDSNRFRSVFEGNGHTISNLYINRSRDNIGLFAVTANAAEINNLKLSDVDVTGVVNTGSLIGINYGPIISVDVTGAVNGVELVGGLVGTNWGTITRCVANVMVTGNRNNVGGLVGDNLIGVISESRASGNVIGTGRNIGGLVGNNGSNIANSYAEGTVSGNRQIGGLVGRVSFGSITNSYAISRTDGSSSVGGLVGFNFNSLITASYWNTDIFATSAGGTGKTKAELQSPTAPGTTSTEIYYGWSEEIWDFGSTNTYPLLRFTTDNDGDIDKDGDGLIEIYDLEGLNEMRHQLDGSGHKTSASGTKITQGCPESGCIGYELMKDLDFNANASYHTTSNKVTWTTASGWSPIGSDSNRFSGVFEGNGHTISNLYIDRNSNNIGLFAVTAATAQIQNIKLLNATIQGAIDVGSLVGSNFGLIINSDVTTATIVGNSQIGGLVGANRGDIISSFAYADVIGHSNVGGLVGDNTSNIISTYAAGTVSSTQTVSHAGGLVGANGSSGSIRNSYAVSRVMPLTDENSQVGGLVGDDSGSITASYWDKTVNAHLMTSDGDGAKTAAELQNPTAPGATSTDTYYGWRTTAWDFGDNTHYPTLYYATTDSITVSACAGNTTPSSALPRCGSRIPNQAVRNLSPTIELPPLVVSDITLRVQPSANANGTINEGSTATLTFDVSGGTDMYQYESKIDDAAEYTSFVPPFIYSIADDFIADGSTSQIVTLTIRVSDPSAEIAAFEHTETLHIIRINNGPADINLSITSATLTAIVGTDPDGNPNPAIYTYQWQSNTGTGWMNVASTSDPSYTISGDSASASGEFRVQVTYTDGQGYEEMLTSNEIRYTPPNELPPLIVSDIRLSVQPPANVDGTINEGSTATITFEVSGGTDMYQYESKIDDAAEYTSFQPPFMYSIADDFIAADTTSQIVTLTIKVSDQSAEIAAFEHTEKLHIRKTNNGPADINLSITSATLTAIVGADPDGDATTPSYTYQWQTKTGAEWMDIASTTDTSYTISGDLASASGEFRVQVVYTDGQGYEEMLTSNEIRYTPPNELPPLIVSDIQLSVQPPANVDGTINEGSTATITFEVSGGTDMYQYASKIDDAVYTSFVPPFIYSIADDFIADGSTSQIVTLTIRVSDPSAEIADSEHTAKLHIRGTNNGSADINLSITSATLTAIVGADPDGDVTTPSYTYQWQTKTGDEWMNVASTTDTSYTISGDLASASGEFRVQVMYTDGQGYTETPISNEVSYIPTSELQPLMVSDIQLSVQPPANTDGTINEGSTATLTFNVSGGTGVYQYASKIDDAAYTSFVPPFIYSIADDFIADGSTSQIVTLTIRVSDQSDRIEASEHTAKLHIRGINNGPADINISMTNTTLTATIGTDPDGDPNPPTYTYQWQANTGSDWMDIASTTDTSYTISGDLASASGEFRVQVMYTDGQGYQEAPISNEVSYTQPPSSGLRVRTKVFLEGPLR